MNPSIDGDNSEVYVTMYIHLNVLMKCTVIEQLLQTLRLLKLCLCKVTRIQKASTIGIQFRSKMTLKLMTIKCDS